MGGGTSGAADMAQGGQQGGQGSKRRHSLSAVMICFNEADRIGDSLRPLAGWAEQVLVLDGGSTDGTQDIVRGFAGVELHELDWPGEDVQRQRGLDMAGCDYVLVVDADEVATDGLKREIDALLARESPPLAARVPIWTEFLGRRVRFGRMASPRLRLFRREGARYSPAALHAAVQVPGVRGHRGGVRLRHGLQHASFRDYRHLWDKHLHYGVGMAQLRHDQGKRSGLARAFARGTLEFLHQYLLRGMILDGWRGLLLAKVLADYAFHRYAGLWALEQQRRLDAARKKG